MTLFPRRDLLALALLAALAGCATTSPRPGDADIDELLTARGGPPAVSDQTPESVRAWLSEPMTAERAVRMAMLRSPRLQEEYARLGLAHAEVLEAVQVENPRLSLSWLALDPGSGEDHTVGLSLPLADLLVLPMRARLADAEFERARLEIAAAVLGVASEVEAAWYAAIGAQQVAQMRAAVAEGAATSAELAQRFYDAGNISELQLRQEQAVASSARIDSLRASSEAARARLELTRAIGLSGKDADWAPADRLPMPVAEEDPAETLVTLAREGNLELLAARQEVEVLADALGITRRLRWIGGSEIGYEQEDDADGQRLRGPTLELELPIFNQGQAKLARAEALLAGALARVAQAELAVEQGVRLNAHTVATLRDVVVAHQQALIPQREAVVARRQEQQNYMLIGVFELIRAKVDEYDAYQSYLEAVRDYWLARVELARIVGQRLPSDAAIGERTPSVQEILSPGEAGMDHSGHGGMDHAAPETVDHSKHGGSAPAEPEAMDHSGHEGMDHGEPAPESEPEPENDAEEEDEHAHHHGATP